MKFKLTENKKRIKCYNIETGEEGWDLYRPELFGIKYFAVNSDGSLNVQYDVYLNSNRGMHYFPFQFHYVDGDFYALRNINLRSLKGSPKYVGNNYSCSKNESLRSLEYCPEYVAGHFFCYENNITDMTGSPKFIGGRGNFRSNKLISFKGAPKFVADLLDVHDNALKSTKGAPITTNEINLYDNTNITDARFLKERYFKVF